VASDTYVFDDLMPTYPHDASSDAPPVVLPLTTSAVAPGRAINYCLDPNL